MGGGGGGGELTLGIVGGYILGEVETTSKLTIATDLRNNYLLKSRILKRCIWLVDVAL